VRRRRFLATLAGMWAAAVLPARARAEDYAWPVEVLDAIDRLEADVDARLRSLAAGLPAASPFAQAVLADHERHRRARGALRRRFRLPVPATPSGTGEASRALDSLRTAQEALVHAHAEGLPALGDPGAVDLLAHHMVEDSRHLTVIDLWIEMEANRG
jgi:hypothetical protein